MTVEAFLVEYIKGLHENYSITVVTNTEDADFLKGYGIDFKVISAPIKREISPQKDIVAFLKLYSIFRKENFHSVHSVTPKAGLLSMCASFIARVPVRIHTFTGQVWATKRGISRWFLKFMDRLIVFFATHILVDSKSQRDFLIKEGIVKPDKAKMIGHGSICGVDVKRFSFDNRVRDEIRKQLGIPISDFVFIFIGRLKRDKGILDLIKAFSSIKEKYRNTHLLVVGPDEEGIKDSSLDKTPYIESIHFVGITKEPEKYMSAADCLCLPSYREGFGLVVLEAAACGIPAIGSRIYGVTDAIEEGVTGLLHEPGNVDELIMHMEWILTHGEERSSMGKKARERAVYLFSREQMVEKFKSFYKDILRDQ